MNFQSIPKVENAQFFLDVAFKAGKDSAERERSVARGTRLEKSKSIELARVVAVKKTAAKKLDGILRVFPSFDQLNEFYKGLLHCYVDVMLAKKSLAAVAWANGMIERVFLQSMSKIKRAHEVTKINDYRRAFYGRAASVLKQIDDKLQYLEKVRYAMKGFPCIKEKYFTVTIAGFPNVGKTTLLSRLSGSTPEIREYSFTTKSLNLGYVEESNVKIQLIDTPGTLNRFEKMNNIEKQAYLAIEHCAHVIVYVFDLTEPYPIADQKKLLEELQNFEKPILYYLSKTDILPKQKQEAFGEQFPVLSLSELKKHLFLHATDWVKAQKEIEERIQEMEGAPSENEEEELDDE